MQLETGGDMIDQTLAYEVTLPFPPTVNGLYRNLAARGRVKTQRYLTWIRAAQNSVLAAGPRPTITGPVRVKYDIGRPDKRRRDLFNLEKAVSDLLVDAHILKDDSQIIEGRLRWVDGLKGVSVRVYSDDERGRGTTESGNGHPGEFDAEVNKARPGHQGMIQRPCQECGVLLTVPRASNRRFCPPCIFTRVRIAGLEYNARQTAGRRAAKKYAGRLPASHLIPDREIRARFDAAGIRYGPGTGETRESCYDK